MGFIKTLLPDGTLCYKRVVNGNPLRSGTVTSSGGCNSKRLQVFEDRLFGPLKRGKRESSSLTRASDQPFFFCASTANQIVPEC